MRKSIWKVNLDCFLLVLQGNTILNCRIIDLKLYNLCIICIILFVAAVDFFQKFLMMFEKSVASMELLKAWTYPDPSKELKFLELER